ncbi:hypothetical protein Pint_08662 [Pistacia integerrima]|uniref:Uncharacterized protein n=2 Tax=Pistacia TaxID=55512 RepID=A0ACC1AIJ1_9ROSI|nr:hypothetical protein Pint_08662 [Pistacia integerrima]KAJ0086482.1 hypothetical protein Patl1_08841 [Pistacia atlantica]
MGWWHNAMFPIRRVWNGVALRLGIRKTDSVKLLTKIVFGKQAGLLRLRGDVRSCEYRDVQVMWEMLKRNEAELTRSPRRSRKRFYWNFFGWARCTPYIGRNCP